MASRSHSKIGCKFHEAKKVSIGLGIASIEALHQLLECPICTNYMYPPIQQCPNGHALCSDCARVIEGDNCPTCRSEMGNIRCLTLEKLVESLEFPCKYADAGCHEIFQYSTKVDHEKHCIFRPYSCPIDDADCWTADDALEMVAHLRDYHNADVDGSAIFSYDYIELNDTEFCDRSWDVTVISCFGEHFIVHFESFLLEETVQAYIAYLRYMGDEKEKGKFKYSLKMERNGRKLRWEGAPRSIRECGREEIRQSLDGLIIHKNCSLLNSEYMDGMETHKLRVSVNIWKEGYNQ